MPKYTLKRSNDMKNTKRPSETPASKKRTPDAQKAHVEAVRAKKRRLKRACIIVCAVFVLCGVLLAVLAGIDRALKASPDTDEPQTPTLNGKHYINFYEPDYDADILSDSDYLAENRTLRYVIPASTGSMSLVLDEYDIADLTEGQRFFVRYFEALISGDTDTYHTFFSPEYIESPGFETHPTDRVFPAQRIYDVTVTELGRTDPTDASYTYNGKSAVFGVYEVRYKILKNDGELRYDLPENGENPLIFELVTTDAGTENEATFIKAQYKYADIRSDTAE